MRRTGYCLSPVSLNVKGVGNISLGLNHLLKNYVHYLYDQGQSWQKGNGQEGGKDPREITPQDNPLLGTLPRKGRTGKTKQN